MFACQECGHKFKTSRAADKALGNGCPICGGTDIDLDVELEEEKPNLESLRPVHSLSIFTFCC